ncbi:hypothetical protein KBD33_06745 [Candidatus Gracilibacteria bacterium]|nr:hypothetical protein [Candidatus Gracilibacteria bacterium]
MNHQLATNSQEISRKEKSVIFCAIQSSMTYLSEILPQKGKYLESFASRISLNTYSSETEMIDDFIAFLDIFFIEPVVDQREYGTHTEDKYPHLSLYGREKNYENLCSGNECGQYISECILRMKYVFPVQKNITDSSICSIPTTDSLFDGTISGEINDLIYISKPISLHEYASFFDRASSSEFSIRGKLLILGSIDLGENIIIQFSIYDKNFKEEISSKYIQLFQFSHEEDAITHPDIQSVFRGYLSHGYDILGKKVETATIPEVRNTISGNVEHLLAIMPNKRRLQKIWPLRIGTSEEDVSLILDKHIEHYTRFFEDPIIGKPQILLTNSGAGANNMVSNILKEKIPNKKDWAGLNFYYENARVFGTEQVSEDTRVLGFCPSHLLPGWNDSDAKLEILYLKEVQKFFQNAQNNLTEEYYLFIDMSTRIEKNISDMIPLEDIPTNVTIITTASLTKYQRGELNYFFGSIMVYNNSNLTHELQKRIDVTIGKLNTDQILALPRLRKSEIIRNSENRQKNREAFESRFKKILSPHSTLPMPRLIRNDFALFIFLPIPEILYFMEHNTTSQGKSLSIHENTSYIKLNRIDKNPIGFNPDIVPSFLFPDLLNESGIALRDSFGFPISTTSSIWVAYSTFFSGEDSLKPLKKIEIPRVSFGYILNEGESSFQGECFALSYLEYMYNRIGFPYENG